MCLAGLGSAAWQVSPCAAAVCLRRAKIENFNPLKSLSAPIPTRAVYTPSTVVPMGMQTGFRGLFAAFAVNHRI